MRVGALRRIDSASPHRYAVHVYLTVDDGDCAVLAASLHRRSSHATREDLAYGR